MAPNEVEVVLKVRVEIEPIDPDVFQRLVVDALRDVTRRQGAITGVRVQ